MNQQKAKRFGIGAAVWSAVIFASSCTFISRRVFIDFVKRYIPGGVPRQLWVNFWNSLGIFVVKSYHVAEYAFLCWLVSQALVNRRGSDAKQSISLGASAALLFAISDEWHQTFVPGRGGTWVDIVIDCIGIGTMAAVLMRKRPV